MALAAERLRKETQFFETYESPIKLVEELLSEHIDYAIVEASVAKSILSQKGLEGRLYVAKDNLFESNLGFFVRTSNEKLVSYMSKRIDAFKKSKDENELRERFIIVPKDYRKMLLIAAVALAIAIIFTLVFLGWRKGWFKRIANSYTVKMNGLLMIRPSPSMRSHGTEEHTSPTFREKFASFQTRYPSIETRLDYQHSAVKIEFRTMDKTRVDSKEFLDGFANNLEDLISAFATDKYILELNITGECSSMFEFNRFVLTNNGGKVGLMVTEFKKKLGF